MAKVVLEWNGIDRLRAVLARAAGQGPKVVAGPLFRFAHQYILLPAKREYVPVVTSALRNSIKLDGPSIVGNVVEVEVGAGGAAAPYALAVHENPRAGKTGGISPSGKKYKRWSRVGGWKYLETPSKLAASRPEPLIKDVQDEVRKLFGG